MQSFPRIDNIALQAEPSNRIEHRALLCGTLGLNTELSDMKKKPRS